MLTGTLEEFSLADVFRLLSLARKTGRLTVERQAGRGRVLFRRGDVIYAESSLVRELVGQKLVRAGAATQGQLRKALDRQAATGERLGRILIESGVVDRPALEAAIRSQTEEAVFDLLRWELGEFNWQPTEEVAAEVPIAVSVENLIMEASRRLDELEVIERKIPSLDYVATVASHPPEGAVEINITPEEWRLLVLVDGRRSLAEIGRAAGFEDFGTLRAIYGLVSAGLVRVLRPEDVTSDAAPPGRPIEQGEPLVEPFTVEPEDLLVPEDVAEAPGESEAAEAPAEDQVGAPETRPLRATPSASLVGHEVNAVSLDASAANGLPAEDDLGSPTGREAAPQAQTEALSSGPPSSESRRAPEEGTPPPPVPSGPVEDPASGPSGTPPAQQERASDNGRGGSVGNGSPPGKPTSGEDPRLDRSSAARELAGLLDDPPPARSEPRRQGDSGDGEEAEDRRKRVEDDDQVTRGLISRFIDGVKGL